jgi:hypothetical protein
MSLKQEFEVLRRVPMFAEIEPAKLKLLASCARGLASTPAIGSCSKGIWPTRRI